MVSRTIVERKISKQLVKMGAVVEGHNFMMATAFGTRAFFFGSIVIFVVNAVFNRVDNLFRPLVELLLGSVWAAFVIMIKRGRLS